MARFIVGASGENPISHVTELEDTTIPAGNTDFLPSDISGSDDLQVRGLLVIKVQLDSSVTFAVNEKISGTDHVGDMNGGSALNAGAMYVFDSIITKTGHDYNFQLGGAATIDLLQIDFIAGEAV